MNCTQKVSPFPNKSKTNKTVVAGATNDTEEAEEKMDVVSKGGVRVIDYE